MTTLQSNLVFSFWDVPKEFLLEVLWIYPLTGRVYQLVLPIGFFSITALQKWWFFTAIYFILGLLLGTFANSSAPLLSLNKVHPINNSASGISNIGFYSKIISLNGKTSLVAVDKAMYSVSVVLNVISVWWRPNHVMGHHAYLMTHPVLDITELGSSQVYIV